MNLVALRIFLGKKSLRLLERDIISIPPRRSTVAVTGAVLRPAYFELKKHETLANLIQYAGGRKHSAGNDIVLIRSDNNNQYFLWTKKQVNYLFLDQ